MTSKKWFDNDVSLEQLKSKTIAVIGYGIQGRAQANNMKDSGLNVIIGLYKEGKSWKIAENDGHAVKEVKEASKLADIIHVLIPDMEQASVYKNDIEPGLSEGKTLTFSHGVAIHWKWIIAPKNIDVVMVAPKGPGQKYENYIRKVSYPVTCRSLPRLFQKCFKYRFGIGKGHRKHKTRCN